MKITPDIGKALSALAVSVCIASALIVAPSFAPKVEAGVPHPLAKADKLEVRPLEASCGTQTWPNISSSCLRVAGSREAVVQKVRIIQ